MHNFSRKKIHSTSSLINTSWRVEESRRTYNIQHWGQGYFDISLSGNVTFCSQEKQLDIELNEIERQEKAEKSSENSESSDESTSSSSDSSESRNEQQYQRLEEEIELKKL